MPGKTNLPQNVGTAAPTGLDPDIINLTKAIRDTETPGIADPYTAKGGSGEFGAYQFTAPTWNKVAPISGVHVPMEQATREQQNKVAYDYVKSLRDQGYNPGQIASIWNSGKADPTGKVGVNSFGVAYNTPQYVDNVYNRYMHYKGAGTTPDADGQPGKKLTDEHYGALFPNPGINPDGNTVVEGLKGGARALGNLPTSAYGVAKGIADVVFHPITTIQNIAGISIGAAEHLDTVLGGMEHESENTDKYNMLVEALKNRYGSIDALQNTAVNDPFGFGADVLGLISGGLGAVGKAELAGDLISQTGRQVTNPLSKFGRGVTSPVRFGDKLNPDVLSAAENLGIGRGEIPAAAQSNSRVVSLAESLAGKGLGGAEIGQRGTAMADKLITIADDIVRAADGAEDLSLAGETLAKGLTKFTSEFKTTVSKLYDDFEKKAGEFGAQTGDSVKLINEILDRKEAIGDIEGAKFFRNKLNVLTRGEYPSEIKMPKGRKAKGKFPAPTFATLKEMRTDLGERIGTKFGDSFVKANDAQLKRLYGSLTNDMRATIKARRGSKKLLEELDKATAVYKAGRQMIDTSLIKQIQRFAKNKQFDKILPALLRQTTSIQDIKTIMAITGDVGTAQIRTTLLRSIFDKATGIDQHFTPGGIEKQLKVHGDKWKQILTPEQYKAIEDLSTVSRAMGRAAKITEGSQTAFLVHQLAQAGIVGWAMIDLMSGNVISFAQKMALLGMDYGGSKLIASPFGQKLMTGGFGKGSQIAAAVAEERAMGNRPPGEDGNILGTYGESSNKLEAPAEVAAPVKKLSKKDEKLKASLMPIIERAKTRSGLDFTVEDVQMTGSRSVGKGKGRSDTDVIVEISGEADEAAVLAALRRGRTKLDGSKVDYTVVKKPIEEYRKTDEDPAKYDTPMKSEFVPDTFVGRMKQSIKNYLDNIQPGLSTKDVTEGGQKYDIGLTSVKGAMETNADDLVKQADTAFAAGKFEEAQKMYNEALKVGANHLSKAFDGTGIKIKPRGVGYGVYGKLEPNYDAVAVVPKGKEDLFHYILADVADRDFHQYSMLTYRQAPAGTVPGIVDEARGISNEPHLRYNLDKEITAKDVSELQKAAEDAGLAGLSIREGGKSIDIINLTKYNDEYEKFIGDTIKFEQALKQKGFSGTPEYRTAEVRFVGSDPSEGHGFASYEQVRSGFRSQNPSFFDDEGVTSRALERIKNKESVSPSEIEQLLNQQDITPIERSVVLSALDEVKDMKKIPVKDLALKVKEKSLPVTMYETDSYANYGIDNVGIREADSVDNVKTLVFETPVEHGNQGHFNNPKHFGHTRVAITEEDGKKIGYVTEMQSDVAQKADLDQAFVDKDAVRAAEGAVRTKYEDQVAEARRAEDAADDEVTKARDLARFPEDAEPGVKIPTNDEIEALKEIAHQRTNERRELMDKANEEIMAAGKAKLDEGTQNLGQDQKQLMAMLKDRNKYQDVMLRGTLQYFEKNGVQEVRIATPSTAAKIEGFVGEYGDNVAPYEINGRPARSTDDDLSEGDTIDYLGDEHIVLAADPYSVTVAKSDKVRSFDMDDHIQEEVQYRWDEEGKSDFAKLANKKGVITRKKLEKAVEDDKWDSWISNGVASDITNGETGIRDFRGQDTFTLDEIEEMFKDKYEYQTDFQDELKDVYGNDNVFFREGRPAYSKGRRPVTVYVVEDGAGTESLEQPSAYDGVDEDTLASVDKDPSAGESFSDSQRAVLDNYHDLRKGALRKLEKTENIKIKYNEDALDDIHQEHTWYSFPLPKVKRYLFGA